MDYTLTVIYADGQQPQNIGCATLTDVYNHIASVLRSQERHDLPSANVVLHVAFNHKNLAVV